MTWSGRVLDLGRVLEAAEAASPGEAVEQVARELARVFGALTVSFLIADLSGRALVRLAHVPLPVVRAGVSDGPVRGERRVDEESATVLPLDGGPGEHALRTQRVLVVPPDEAEAGEADTAGSWRVLAPVTERGETMGLLELYLPKTPDDHVVGEIGKVAHLLAFVVIANRRHTDLYEWGQRSRAFSLSAEIQQRLLPEAHTCEAASFTLAGWLEPAASIGGDTFDYSVARDLLHLSLTDAMGHGVDAALTASLCLGGLRGARRRGESLLDQARFTNTALAVRADSLAEENFVTGLVGRIELRSGSLEVVNAGHAAPFLLRDSTVTTLDLRVDLPFGMFEGASYGSTRLILEPGDRLVLVTDGMLERNVASLDLPGVIRATRDLHPREVVRELADGALVAAGRALKDDATVLCLDWHGQHGESRDAVAGADRHSRAVPSASVEAMPAAAPGDHRSVRAR